MDDLYEKLSHVIGYNDYPDHKRYLDLSIPDMEMADLIVTISEWAKESLCKYGVPAKKIVVIPEGTDFITEDAALRQGVCANPATGPLKLLYAGTIEERKGFYDVIEAMEMLRDASLELVADGSLHPGSPFPRIIADRNLPIRLSCSPTREELFRRMGESSVFVFPRPCRRRGPCRLRGRRDGDGHCHDPV